MASKYEEMCDVAKTARKNWSAHRDRCRQYMATLITGLLRYCGIPNEAVKFARWDESSETFIEPEQGDVAYPALMHFDETADCRLGVYVTLTPPGTFPARWASFVLFVSEKNEKVYARLGPDKAIPIDLNNELECAKFYEGIVANIKRAFTEPPDDRRDSIGFKRSRLATNGNDDSGVVRQAG
jgi:hypothetical protein